MRSFFVACVLVIGCSSSSSKQEITAENAGDGGQPDGSVAPPKTGSESGSRLKARTLAGADGSKQFTGWFDSERKENCGFVPAADGKTRCLPTATSTLGYYADDTCTQRLAYGAKNCAPPKYVVYVEDPIVCAAGVTSIATIGTKFTGATLYVKGATCTGTPSASTLTTYDLFYIGTPIEPASFVEATEQTEP